MEPDRIMLCDEMNVTLFIVDAKMYADPLALEGVVYPDILPSMWMEG